MFVLRGYDERGITSPVSREAGPPPSLTHWQSIDLRRAPLVTDNLVFLCCFRDKYSIPYTFTLET